MNLAQGEQSDGILWALHNEDTAIRRIVRDGAPLCAILQPRRLV